MATITSTGSGLWSAAGTWDTGVPVDNDVVVIASGHTVEFDVDQSGFANGIDGITVTGTLSLTRTAGTYYLKVKAAKTIAGAGTFDCGTLASPIPFTAKHTITGGAAWYINGASGLTMTVYDTGPTNTAILLSGDEAAGQTVLSVDTDVTGDIWAEGDQVRVCDINKASEGEWRTIAAAGIAASTITITAGLTAAKSTGAVVCLVVRHLKFIAVGATSYICSGFSAGNLTVAGGQWTAVYRVFVSSTTTISGGSFHGSSHAILFGGKAEITGGVFNGCSYVSTSTSLTISGGEYYANGYVTDNTPGARVSGGTYKGNNYVFGNSAGISISGGTFFGNTVPVYTCAGASISGGTFSSNTQALLRSSASIKNATMNTNTYDINQSVIACYNILLDSATENTAYTSLAREIYSESIDHDQTAGAFRAWTKGGITSSQAVTVPTGYTKAMQTVLESATSEGFWQKEVLVAAGASVEITMNLRKDASMTYLPRCIVFNKASTDPFSGGAGLNTFTMTDSVDTWEDDTYTYTNSGTEDVTLVIRLQGMNATGNMYSALTVNVINVDLTSALTKLDAIDLVVDAILDDTGTSGVPLTAAAVDAVLDDPVEGAVTLRQALRVILAAIAGKATGGGTNTITFRDVNDTVDRITATVDASGNRSAVTVVST